ncbi:GntR family transcriptional regulator [Cellulomonas marina]|uniref:DNA-binding transcriptional regulator YhcF, GntR family n=1 Tax=Cellulomonas marina TaxID=988821 RepID=A0A1I1AKJ4_9CELL|nr:GntR family transcriptional regulator [Cellulomonas marina]GIG30801.1 GntR family transcriptional regulator [Cellulomonas marina]SFB38561.1 DNA-binding transcriptional regulator YhcF, GntR family [Cellulomonas marina]
MLDDSRPIFVQVAERIAGDVLDGTLPEGSQVPSTTELSAFLRINPATVAKGMAELVATGVLHKRRGIGMFVSEGARARLQEQRRAAFVDEFVAPLVREAGRLGLAPDEVARLVVDATRGAGAVR